jgi:spore coat protein CotF
MNQQNNQTIQNPKPANEPKVKGPEMNDRDRVNDILAMEKYLTDSLNIAAREASHEGLHKDVMTVLNECHQAARDMYNLMFQKGWYKLEAEEQQKLDQTYQQFSQYSSQFPYQTPLQ